MGAIFDRLCAAACPGCPDVCCLRVSRRSLIDDADWLYLAALSVEPADPAPLPDPLPVDDGCPFLAPTGCLLPWPARPFACAHYVCDRLAAMMTPYETAQAQGHLSEAERLRGELRNAYLEAIAW